MRMLVICDTTDIIEVPQFVIDDRELYRRRFRKWIQDETVRHKYWVAFPDRSKGLRFRTGAFVEWLNKKVLKSIEDKARIVAECVDEEQYKDLPSTWF